MSRSPSWAARNRTSRPRRPCPRPRPGRRGASTMRLTMARPMPVPGNSRAMQPLEHAEQLVDVLHVEADPGVADEVDGLAVAGGRADLDPGAGFGAVNLIALSSRFSPDALATWPHRHALPAASRFRSPARARRSPAPIRRRASADQLVHVDRRRLHFDAAGAREGQDVVDQPAHLDGAVAHHLEHALAFGVELVGIVLEQDAREPVDGPQRRAQIVRDRIGESPPVPRSSPRAGRLTRRNWRCVRRRAAQDRRGTCAILHRLLAGGDVAGDCRDAGDLALVSRIGDSLSETGIRLPDLATRSVW